MYLKKVRIFGFKSFADEIIFDFSKGITAIVGPNGCGKSNVLDAFNWVLGEQSAVRLRGKQMQDMIFHGSRTRKPLGVALVELVLDNSRDLLSIDYNEVTVTRKLYRSGESEYFINRNPCRLKDIKELFLDTGIGTRAYSIMEQDNIKYILESSPVERRGIIEAAAGIRKFKEKKIETERRLERVNNDLNEVKNIMAEVQKNIRRLRRQTRRAQVYRDLKYKLRYLEISRLCQEYVKACEQLGGKEKLTGDLQEEVTLSSGRKDTIDAQIIKLEDLKNSLDEKLLDSNRNVYQIESKVQILNERIQNFDSSRDRLEEEIYRNSKNLQYSTQRIEQLNDKIQKLEQSRNEDIEKEHIDMEKKYVQLRKQHKEIQQEIEKIEKATEQMEENLFELRHKEIDYKKQAEMSVRTSEELNARLVELNGNSKLLNVEMSEQSGILKGLESELKICSDDIGKLSSIRERISKDAEHLNTERENLLSQFHGKKSQLEASKKYLPQLISIESLMKNKFKGIHGPLSTLLEKEVSTDRLGSLSKILGEKIGWVICDEKQNALDASSAISLIIS
ncbi:AAA family ATPase [Elusimicrobiota bacterium]